MLLDRDAGAVGQRGVDAGLDVAPTGVVEAEAATGVGHDGVALAGAEREGLQAEADPERGPQRALAVAHGLGQHPGHAQVALGPARHLAVAAFDAQRAGAVEEVGQHRQLHPGLAEAGQHLLDVAEEQAVGADDEHALALEREAVRVEQVGGAVQRHDGLAGARTPLHDEHAGQVGPDDLVLLALDRGDDVGEAPGADLLERGDQGALAPDLPAVVDDRQLAAEEPGGLAEQLVLDGQQLAAPGGEVAAADQAHRRAPGGPVEGLGHRGPPVDHQRLPLLVGHGQAPDVEAVAPLALGAVDPPEHEAGVAELEGGQPVGDVALDHLPLPPGLLRAALAHLDHRAQTSGLEARALEAVVGTVDVGLFGGQVGMGRHHPPRGNGIVDLTATCTIFRKRWIRLRPGPRRSPAGHRAGPPGGGGRRLGGQVGHQAGALASHLLDGEHDPGLGVVVVVADGDGPRELLDVVVPGRQLVEGHRVVVDRAPHGLHLDHDGPS